MKKYILIVEDEPGLAFFLAENLADLGPNYEIAVCNSGQEALQLQETMHFDLIISDLMMPGINGLQLIRALRQREYNPAIILMTAYGHETAAREAKTLGITGYITKPFQIEEMLTEIRNIFEAGTGQRLAKKVHPVN